MTNLRYSLHHELYIIAKSVLSVLRANVDEEKQRRTGIFESFPRFHDSTDRWTSARPLQYRMDEEQRTDRTIASCKCDDRSVNTLSVVDLFSSAYRESAHQYRPSYRIDDETNSLLLLNLIDLDFDMVVLEVLRNEQTFQFPLLDMKSESDARC